MVLAELGFAAFGVILLCFGFVLLFGAPFLPTLKPQVGAALELLDLKPGQTMLELGCGDGRVLIAAAKQGLNAVGYELNPILFVVAYLRCRPYQRHVRVVWGNYWMASWPKAEGIFGFILPRYMSKLHKKVMQYSRRPIKVASFAFAISEMKPAKTKAGVFLYVYK
jgi:hypothetical protein